MSPYTDASFYEFFLVLLKRIYLGSQNSPSLSHLATDEIQLIVLLLVGSGGAILGTWITLRKMAMLANGLSHTILLGIVGAFISYRWWLGGNLSDPFQTPFHLLVIGAVASALLTSLLTQVLNTKLKIREDASTGIVLTSLFATSLLLINITTRNTHLSTEAIMGNVDGLKKETVYEALVIFGSVLLVHFFFFKHLLITTFDPLFALSAGFKPSRVDALLMGTTAFLLTLAFSAVGVIQVLAFLTVPPIFGGLLSKKIKQVFLLSVSFSIGSTILAVALSRHFLTVYSLPLSTGSLLVTLQGLGLVSFLLLKKLIDLTTYNPSEENRQ